MPDTPDDLYRALGKALARWQYIEVGLFLLFHGLKRTSFEESSHDFFETDWKKLDERKRLHGKKKPNLSSISNKLREIDRLCRAHLKPEIIAKRWVKIHDDLDQHREIRNAIAHFEPGQFIQPIPNVPGPARPSGTVKLGISPQVLDRTKVGTNGLDPALYIDEILQAADEFLTTAQDLIKFGQEHVPHWEDQLNLIPIQGHMSMEGIMRARAF